ncbi:hypothetical protein INR49_031856 [Caranx melampygus]|nr:hypothetical protein INR49_031856 [Caranx melampygus]
MKKRLTDRVSGATITISNTHCTTSSADSSPWFWKHVCVNNCFTIRAFGMSEFDSQADLCKYELSGEVDVVQFLCLLHLPALLLHEALNGILQLLTNTHRREVAPDPDRRTDLWRWRTTHTETVRCQVTSSRQTSRMRVLVAMETAGSCTAVAIVDAETTTVRIPSRPMGVSGRSQAGIRAMVKKGRAPLHQPEEHRIQTSNYVSSAIPLVEMIFKVVALGLLYRKESYCCSTGPLWTVVGDFAHG